MVVAEFGSVRAFFIFFHGHDVTILLQVLKSNSLISFTQPFPPIDFEFCGMPSASFVHGNF